MKAFWIRDQWSCIPQTWTCSSCGWSGIDPSIYTRPSFDDTTGLVSQYPNWPSRPECERHSFYVKGEVKSE